MKFVNPSYIRFSLSLTGNMPDAEDLVNTSYEKIIKKYGNESIENEGLMIRTIRNTFIDKTRFDKKFSKNIDIDDLQIVDDSATAEDELINNEQENKLKEKLRNTLKCLKELNEIQRSVVSLKCIENKSYQEIANSLKIALGTVMSSLSRGRLAIADCVAKRS